MNKLLAHIRILRPLNLTIGAFSVIITASILKQMNHVGEWLNALMVVVFYNAAANTINDYFDMETDKINRPKRPLITGDVQPKIALYLSIILFTIGTLLAITLPFIATFIAVAIALPIMISYSIWFKGMPLVGNFIIAMILGLTFLFAGAALGNLSIMIIPALLAFGLTITRELVKDISDIEGDRKANLKTIPIVIGMKKAWIVVFIFSVLMGIGAIIPFIIGKYNSWYIIFVINILYQQKIGVYKQLIIVVIAMMLFA